jgi:hypothetical protein
MQFGYPDHSGFHSGEEKRKNTKSTLLQEYVADVPDLNSSPPPSRRRRKAILLLRGD